jgi:Tetracyclin repressor-like, C-terminal domain
MEFIELMSGAATPEEAGELCLDFALSHPREYELFYRYEYRLYYSQRSNYKGKMPGRPGTEAMKRKLAEEFGGSPEDHTQLTLALWMLAHGAAMLIIGKTVLPSDVEAARAVFSKSVKALLNGVQRR